MLQNIKKPVYNTIVRKKTNSDSQNSDFSSKSFVDQRDDHSLQQRHYENTSQKRYTENTSLSNIYQRFYRPGSYALRGVIDHNICLQMGAPLFLLAFPDASLDPILIVVPEESLITFNCYIALLKASRLIQRMKTFQFYYCHKIFLH